MSQQVSLEGDPKKLAWFRDARWTTNHPLEVKVPGELQVMPGTCEACVWGRGDHSEICPKKACTNAN